MSRDGLQLSVITSGDHDPMTCRRCGLHLLSLYIRSREWVNRRTEQVFFTDDRTVRRRVSVDLTVPAAPTISRPGGGPLTLLPIALLRRKTLVNFDLSDDSGRALQLLPLRQNQQITSGMLRAWADEVAYDFGSEHGLNAEERLYDEAGAPAGTVGSLLDDLVAGDQRALHAAYFRLKSWDNPTLEALRRDPYFMAIADRVSDTFLLLLALRDSPSGSGRLLKYSYDERLSLRYRASGYKRNKETKLPTYEEGERPLGLRREARTRLGAMLGWTPTTIRFPVPAAEGGASYHFELAAPPGILIESATLLAARPDGNPAEEEADDSPDALQAAADRIGIDTLSGALPRVDLHVVDVPFGSLSRAQARLIVDPRGWLSAMTAATAATTAIIIWAGMAYNRNGSSDLPDTVLVTVVAGVAAILAQPDAHRMITRMLVLLRGAALLSVGCALATGALLAFEGHSSDTRKAILALGCMSGAVFLLMALVLTRVRWLLGHAEAGTQAPWVLRLLLPSPPRECLRRNRWEQDKSKQPEDHEGLTKPLFDHFNRRCEMDTASVRVASSERSRHTFSWNVAFEQKFHDRLERALARSEASAQTESHSALR